MLADYAPQATPPAPPVEAGAERSEPRSDDAKPGARKAPARDRRKVEPGVLSVQSSPWAWVTVGNQRKETPDKFYLAPGSYTVRFYNEDNSLLKSERVTIESGKVLRLDEEFEP